MTTVQTTPAHDAILESIGEDSLTLSEIVTRIRKPAVPELIDAGYRAPLAIQVHLDQLVHWGLLTLTDGVYGRAL